MRRLIVAVLVLVIYALASLYFRLSQTEAALIGILSFLVLSYVEPAISP